MKTYFKILFACFLMSCNSISKEDLTVIDNVQLGTKGKNFYQYCDSLNILKDDFVTLSFISHNTNLDDYRVKFYYSEVVNIGMFSGFGHMSIGLYYPVIYSGTDNVVQLNVLLAHKQTPINIEKLQGDRSLTCADQNVNELLLENIYSLLVGKYGRPKEIQKTGTVKMFVIEKNTVKEYGVNVENQGNVYRWETKALEITFFTGIKEYNESYLIKQACYEFNRVKDSTTSVDKWTCKTYPYIQYSIKQNVIEKLKLDKVNI
jgi:hypothetical protein